MLRRWPGRSIHGKLHDDMIHAYDHPILVDDLDDGYTMFVGAHTRCAVPAGGDFSIDTKESFPSFPRSATEDVPLVVEVGW